MSILKYLVLFTFIVLLPSVKATCPPPTEGCEECIHAGCWFWDGLKSSLCGFPPFPQGGIYIISPNGMCPSTTTTTTTTSAPPTPPSPTPPPHTASSNTGLIIGIISFVVLLIAGGVMAIIAFYRWGADRRRNIRLFANLDDNVHDEDANGIVPPADQIHPEDDANAEQLEGVEQVLQEGGEGQGGGPPVLEIPPNPPRANRSRGMPARLDGPFDEVALEDEN